MGRMRLILLLGSSKLGRVWCLMMFEMRGSEGEGEGCMHAFVRRIKTEFGNRRLEVFYVILTDL